MNFYISQVFNLLIVIVAILGWIRFKRISPAYYPFLILIWVGTANEIYSAVIINYFSMYNIVNSNLYGLIEALLMLWQFKRWGLFWERRKLYGFLFFFFLIIWIVESVVITKMYLEFNSYFRVFYSFILVLLSLSMINQILMKERNKLARNPTFIICISFIFALTYSLLIEMFFIYRLQLSATFNTNLHYIFIVINLFSNLLYFLAILWMPKKQSFVFAY
jgi:hypothetical protein